MCRWICIRRLYGSVESLRFSNESSDKIQTRWWITLGKNPYKDGAVI